jgi:hypothetical protein
MDMLRHYYITDNDKLMALASLLHKFQERDRERVVCEKRATLMTACGDEVGVSSAVVAVQVGRVGMM